MSLFEDRGNGEGEPGERGWGKEGDFPPNGLELLRGWIELISKACAASQTSNSPVRTLSHPN